MSSPILSIVAKVTLGIAGLSFVVLIHEASHYFAARLVKIRVTTFSIGFGKRLLGFQYKGTDYRLSLIPLGGYCRFDGEESLRLALEKRMQAIPANKGDFYASPPWKRILVSIAGPAGNIVLSILVFTVIAWIGYNEQYTEPRIILISEYSDDGLTWPADEAGLKTGDLILEIDDREIDRFQELRQRLIFRPGEKIALTFLRDGKKLSTTITPQLDKVDGRAVIGVMNWVNPVISSIESKSIAALAGLQSGDEIISINNKPVSHTFDIYNSLKSSNTTVNIEFLRDGKRLESNWDLSSGEDLGIEFAVRTGRSEKLGLFGAIGRGVSESWNTIESTLRSIRMMFMGIQLRNAVSGPVRLISLTGETVVRGFQYGFRPGLLMTSRLIAFISISLAFLNLLPIPVLDGGQIVLFITEWLQKRPLKPQLIYRYQIAGIIIVFILTIIATTGDLMGYKDASH